LNGGLNLTWQKLPLAVAVTFFCQSIYRGIGFADFNHIRMPYIDYKGHNLFYEDQGSGHCLFYIHEWNASSLSFRKVNLKYLVKELRVICIDLPGYGNSDYFEGLQFDDFSDIIIHLLDFLKIQRCTFMGFCLGSAIILNFYQKFPGRVNRLILIEPILKFPGILVPLLIPGFGVAFLKYMAQHRFLFSLASSQLIGADEHMNKQIFKGMSRNDPRISGRYLRLLFKKTFRSDYRSLTIDIQTNCICISGENTNLLFKKSAASIIKHFSIRDYVSLSDTRHYVLIEQPAEISKVILGYLKNAGD
jgi:pimeloyl-ACP methyl ester carboxylesterase